MKLAVAGGTGVVGNHVVRAAEAAGHEVVVLSRRRGVDVRSGEGLRAALTGVEAVIDTLNLVSISGKPSEAFFVETTHRLHRAGADAGVQHLVTLSIVGIDRASAYPYYRAKLAQEQAVSAGALPSTVLRATQFHEFPAQLLKRTRKGPVAMVPRMRSQPVAARTVADHLLRAAESRPGRVLELAGPEVHDIVDLTRRLLRARNERVLVIPLRMPGAAARQMRGDALLATAGTTIDGPSYDEWLTSADARQV